MIVTSLSKYRATILKLSYQESALNLSTIPQFRLERPALSNGPMPIPFPPKRRGKSPCQPQGPFCSVCAYHLAFVNIIPQFQLPPAENSNIRTAAFLQQWHQKFSNLGNNVRQRFVTDIKPRFPQKSRPLFLF